MHWRIHKIRQEKGRITSLLQHLDTELYDVIDTDEHELFCQHTSNVTQFVNVSSKKYTADEIDKLEKIASRYEELTQWRSYKTKYASELKEKMLELLSESIIHNQNTEQPYVRRLTDTALVDKNVISVFESSLTRMLGVEKDDLTTDIMVVKVYYFDIIKDLILNGFEYNGEKYKFLTASAGQIRTKKTVFIKESLWNKHERTLMCGLSVDAINEQGGINVNKYLAYLALSNSATDLWEGFDIDRCIVVPDFETDVHGEVDFIDDATYEIERRVMDIGIEHTDGCGMMLPSLSQKNFMVRLPWIKGLLASFDFRKFIEKHGCSPIVTDIYGDEHNIVEEDIQIILTKSQFKMHKYYKNWKVYKDDFVKYGCQAGICNVEEDRIPRANINYQMMQTLTDMTDKELKKIAKPSMDKIENFTSTVSSMLNAFGASPNKPDKTPFQEALLLYPEMLNDVYCKNVLKSIKSSMVNKYRAAKLEVKGKYTFLIPDLYAWCQRLFQGIESPAGLLEDGQVSCRLYSRSPKLDCLRSPHLYREHAVRDNIVDETTKEWFTTDAIYTSCHDMISRILQFDNDGDRALVVADKTIVEVAERNMQEIVPLYYDMKKADPVILNNLEIYNGIHAAYVGGNIGAISNDITKIWNHGDVGEEELKAIKLLCCENNFVID